MATVNQQECRSSAPFDDHPDRKSHFSIDHDVETQSIYGFDQMVHRNPSFALPNQEIIVRNFSRRTLCPNSTQTNLFTSPGLSCSNTNCSYIIATPSKPLNWFESTESIHSDKPTNINMRKSFSFSPLHKQSAISNAFRKSSPSNIMKRAETSVYTFAKYDNIQGGCNGDNVDCLTYVPIKSINKSETRMNSIIVSTFKWIVVYFDLDLLKDNIYLNLMIGMSISIFGEINFAILTPFILSDLKYSPNEIPLILSVIAVADLISRFFSPFVADYFKWSTRTAYLISLILLILTRTGKKLNYEFSIFAVINV